MNDLIRNKLKEIVNLQDIIITDNLRYHGTIIRTGITCKKILL